MLTRASTPVRRFEGVVIFELSINAVFRRQVYCAHAFLVVFCGIILLTSVVVILAVVPAAKANLLALHVKGACIAVLLFGPACVFTESWVRLT